MKGLRVVISCEHAGNTVPRPCSRAFASRGRVLASHRGWDPGALDLAACLARQCAAPLYAFRVSRLVIDANRSPRHPALFSHLMKTVAAGDKNRVLQGLYGPYREQVRAAVQARAQRSRPVLHLSVHTFTPVLKGEKRTADIGLLYDPSRPAERCLAAAWRQALRDAEKPLRVRRNFPYRGTADSLTAWLRRLYPDTAYAGIELEVNQRFVRQGGLHWQAVKEVLAGSIQRLLCACPR